MSFDVTVAKKNPDAPPEMVDKIISIYRKILFIPKVKPKKQFLLCPVGLTGAGKTTVTKPLAEKLNLVRISTDEIRQILKQRGYNYNKVKDISIPIVKDLIKNGYSVAIDGNCGVPETQGFVKQAIEKYNLEVIWVHIDPPEEFIVNKLKNFNHTWLFSSGEEAVNAYYLYKKGHDYKDLNIPFIYTFNTSRTDLNLQINEIIKLIRAKI